MGAIRRQNNTRAFLKTGFSGKAMLHDTHCRVSPPDMSRCDTPCALHFIRTTGFSEVPVIHF